MKLSKISAFAALFASSIVGFAATPAMAATFATDVYDMDGNPLGDGILGDEFDVDNALTPPDSDFYRMNLDESLIFGFGGKQFSKFKIWETTWDNRANWEESAQVSVGNDLNGPFTFVKDIFNNVETTGYINAGGMYTYLKITDTTSLNFPDSPAIGDGNGFDIDAIGIKTVPEPTSILGLLIVGGLGTAVVRKRK